MSDAAILRHHVHSMYSAHHGWLRAWLGRRLGCSERAADLAQDAFVRILTTRQAADAASWREPRAYLTTVARHLVADHWRRQELERAYLEALAAQPELQAPSPETQLLIVETLLRIDDCLNALPTVTRRIFLRSQLDGLVYVDIASEMGVSLPTVKRHMRTAFLSCLSAA